MATIMNEVVGNLGWYLSLAWWLQGMAMLAIAIELIHHYLDEPLLGWRGLFWALLLAPLTLIRYFVRVGRAIDSLHQQRREQERQRSALRMLVARRTQ